MLQALAWQAACAKVVYFSGAGEYSNFIYRDMDSTRALASNGSSADLLGAALTRAILVS